MSVDGVAVFLASTGGGIAGEDEELGVGDGKDFGLRGDAVFAFIVDVSWQGHDEFGQVGRRGVLVLCAVRDVVLKHAGVSSVFVAGAAFLHESGLGEDGEGFAVWRDSEALEALVVGAAGGCVTGGDGAVRVVVWCGVGVEAVDLVST